MDEMDKLFEKIVISFIFRHLSQEGIDLANNQFRFHRGHSTIDTIDYVKSRQSHQRGVALAISFFLNAFNFLPWIKIKKALARHQIPLYLREIRVPTEDYLEDINIEYLT